MLISSNFHYLQRGDRMSSIATISIATSRPGLRERKRLKTYQTIQHEALKLFTQLGYDATTVEQIAEAAQISPSTFFRYFPTKEDVVFTEEDDPTLKRLIEERPAHEPAIEAVRQAMHEWLPTAFADDSEESLARLKLAISVPALRARLWEQQQANVAILAELLSRRTGRDPADFALHLTASACFAVVMTAVLTWVVQDGKADLAALLDQAFAALEAGVPL
jgi:AcrR family transcriptional regulator